jgi:hypothetical protein
LNFRTRAFCRDRAVRASAQRQLVDLISRPAALRTHGLILVGPYANGKTMIAERFAIDHLRTAPMQRVWVVQTREEIPRERIAVRGVDLSALIGAYRRVKERRSGHGRGQGAGWTPTRRF